MANSAPCGSGDRALGLGGVGGESRRVCDSSKQSEELELVSSSPLLLLLLEAFVAAAFGFRRNRRLRPALGGLSREVGDGDECATANDDFA